MHVDLTACSVAHTEVQEARPLWGSLVEVSIIGRMKVSMFFFSSLLSSTQLNFNHTKLLTRKGHLLPLPQNNDQAEE